MPNPPEKIGVIGAGLMGAEIALVFALAGHDVVLADRGAAETDAALARLAGILDRGIQRGFYKEADKLGALSRISATNDLGRLADRDVVTEAVFEDEAVKAELFRALDPIVPAHCLIATNTSSISVSILAAHLSAARRPRFVGTHYFSPVSRMKLVEIIPGFDTDGATVDQAMRLCAGAGKTPIRVKDVVGFAVNRMLHAFMLEAIRLVEEDVATPSDLDTACRLGLGHPMGPFELMDAVSSSLVLQVYGILHDAYGERFRPPLLLKQKVKAGHIGRKAGRGWRVSET